MELIFALAVGILTASGVWLLLRPRTFQVIIGLSLISYAVNLFIFGMGRLRSGAPPVLASPEAVDPGALRRSAAAGLGPHRHRHQLRDDGPVPRRPAGLARPDGYRPCGWTGGHPVTCMDRPPDRRADPAAAGLGGRDAVHGRAPPCPQGRDRGRDHGCAAGRLRHAAAPGRHASCGAGRIGREGVPARQLAGALRHRAGARSPLRAHARADEHPRRCDAAVFARALASCRAAVPRHLPAPAHGTQRRLPDRGPVQPLRVLRGAARRLLRPRPARGRDRAGQGGPRLHRHQPDGLLPLPDRRQPGLRRHRHAQHGGPRQARSRPCPWGCRAHGRRRGDPRHGLPDEGGRVAAQLLAPDDLRGRLRAGGRRVRDHEQARGLRDPAPVDAGARSGGAARSPGSAAHGCSSAAC